MENRVELLNKWMKAHDYTKSQLSRAIEIPLSTVCGAVNPKYSDRVTRFSKFWNACSAFTGIKSLQVKSSDKPKSKTKANVKSLDEVIQKSVEMHLMAFGKTVIDKHIVEKYGEDKIIEYFGKKGIKCKIVIEKDECFEPYHYLVQI